MVLQTHSEERLSAALRKHLEGDCVTAEALYREIILFSPDLPQAKNYLGFLLQQSNRLDEARELLTSAIALDDSHAAWHFNLGVVLARQDEVAASICAFTAAVTLNPHHYFYWTNLGAAFELSEAPARAEQCYIAATNIDPTSADAFFLLSALCVKQSRFLEARKFNCCGLISDPDECQSIAVLGQAYCELGRVEEAIVLLETWLKAKPDDPVATHLLAAYQGGETPDQCSRAYVELTFDEFAAGFEHTLSRLKYAGPQLVMDYLSGYTLAGLSVLDLGCGTGLVGAVLKSSARSLEGVDLSQSMLRQAAEKRIYNQLHQADITEFLQASCDPYDFIVCMDTFIYLGKLDEIIALIYKRLKAGGQLLFSTEKLLSAYPRDFQLNITGRYSHHQDYILRLLAKVGFVIEKISDVMIRIESGFPIEGQFVCVSK
ncbi:MAG: tetratricopeptide repeat protein [Gallionella sp.]